MADRSKSCNPVSKRLFGKRTLYDLCTCVIPGPVVLVTAGLAGMAAAGVNVVAAAMTAWDYPGAAYLTTVGKTLIAMPIWIIIGSAMSQLASRIVRAAKDFKEWRGIRASPKPPSQEA